MEHLSIFIGILSIGSLVLTGISSTVGFFLFKLAMRRLDKKQSSIDESLVQTREMLPALQAIMKDVSEGLAEQRRQLTEVKQELSAMRMNRR